MFQWDFGGNDNFLWYIKKYLFEKNFNVVFVQFSKVNLFNTKYANLINPTYMEEGIQY